MSRFLTEKLRGLTPYTPGEQPKDMKYVKLNTNESPFPPSKKAQRRAAKAAKLLQLYPDPECSLLNKKAAEIFGVEPENVVATNGSDEILNFAFMAYCDEAHPAVFADITYGFYKVFAEINGVPYREIPLNEDFTLNIEAFKAAKGTLFIANPNAPTGIALPIDVIEEIVAADPERMVIIDEAYVDFGTYSAVELIEKYDNLLVTQTFSKSRSMAGARLGFGIGCKDIIADMNTIRFSNNPYNINRMTMAAGLGVMADQIHTFKNCAEIIKVREYTAEKLCELGFETTDSAANFIFAKSDKIDGGELYKKLKARGVLVRHFDTERLREYNRITVGSKKQMDTFLSAVKSILEEQK